MQLYFSICLSLLLFCSLSSYFSFSFMQLLSHTPMVLEFLLQQSEKGFDGGVQLHERNRKILRCLLSWVWFNHPILLMTNPKKIYACFYCHQITKCWCPMNYYYIQVRAGCFSEIPHGLLPAHPLLNFVFNSLQVIYIISITLVI